MLNKVTARIMFCNAVQCVCVLHSVNVAVCVWLCGHLTFCMAVYGSVWVCMAVYVWQCGSVWQCMAVYEYAWQCMCGSVVGGFDSACGSV